MRQSNKKESGLAHLGIIVAVILVVAAVAFGGWWVWDKNKDSQSNSSDSSVQNSGQNEKPKIPDEFLLYENSQFGFSFGYPKQVGSLKSSTSGNSSVLLSVQSDDTKNALAPYTQSPLYVHINEAEGFLASGGKYGPLLEYSNGKWVVSDEDGGDILNGGYDLGSEYKPVAIHNVDGTSVYDFSFTDEGCYRTVWVFRLETSYTTITLPAVCADETDTIPQARLASYKEISDQILETLNIN